MKSTLLLASALTVTIALNAQLVSPTIKVEANETVKAENLHNNKTDLIGWFNYANEMRAQGGRTTWSVFYIWPDTSVKVEYSNGWGIPSFHIAGEVIDPKGPYWSESGGELDSNDLYSVDSVELLYTYKRFQPAADTIKIHIYTHASLQNYFLNPSTDNIPFKTPDYDYMINEGVGYAEEIVEILDDNDTTSANSVFSHTYALSYNVDRAEVMAATVTYHPGNPWNPGDTLSAASTTPVGNKLNKFGVVCDRDPNSVLAEGFYSAGLYILEDNRFNQGNFKGLFYPGYVFTGEYINTAFGFHVNAQDVGVNDVNESGFKVHQNSPNPFSQITYIDYATSKSGNVMLEVFDVTGKTIMTLNQGKREAGSYRIELDGSMLDNGVYYYTLKSENGQVTRKMIVQK